MIYIKNVKLLRSKTKKIKIPKLSKSSDDASKTRESSGIKREIREEKISQEEYEKIWEER